MFYHVKIACYHTPHRKLAGSKLLKIVSLIILNEIPNKKKDHSAPLITCEMKFSKKLLDSGASVNLLPNSLHNKFYFGELEPFFKDYS